MHDNHRSGVTSETLDFSGLEEAWAYRAAVPPAPAWAGAAKWDAYARISGLKSMRNFDPVFYVTAAGDSVFFASSSEECVRSLDSSTGEVKWVFHANGPVRIAPTCSAGRIYFGSDDGHAYCIDGDTGSLRWKVRAAPSERMVPSNNKLISMWPVRTGVLVQDGKAYFAASLAPWETSRLCAVDADDGARIYERTVEGPVTLEGAMLASTSRLYVPQGRVAPVVFDLLSGEPQGSMNGGGGVYCFLTEDLRFIHGPGNKTGWLSVSDAQDRNLLETLHGGNLMVVSGDRAFVQSRTALSSIHRPTGSTTWSVECPYRCGMILAGDSLVLGGDGHVAAFDVRDGARIWSRPVEGRAYGLAVANGTLYVSTEAGSIHAFACPATPD